MLRRLFLSLPFLPLLTKPLKCKPLHFKTNIKIEDNTAYIIAFVNEKLNYIFLHCYGYNNNDIYYSEFYETINPFSLEDIQINEEVIKRISIFSKELRDKYDIEVKETYFIYFYTYGERYNELCKILNLLKPNPLHSRML